MKRLNALGYFLLFAAMFLVVLFFGRRLYWYYFGSGFEKTNAMVVSTSASQGETPTAKYTFSVGGKTYKGKGQIKPLKDNYVTYVAPNVMEIYYDPENPSHNYSAHRSFFCRYMWGPAVMFIILPVVLICAIFTFVYGVVLGRLE